MTTLSNNNNKKTKRETWATELMTTLSNTELLTKAHRFATAQGYPLLQSNATSPAGVVKSWWVYIATEMTMHQVDIHCGLVRWVPRTSRSIHATIGIAEARTIVVVETGRCWRAPKLV